MFIYDESQTNDRLKRPRQVVVPIIINYDDLRVFSGRAEQWVNITATVTKVTASSELVDIDVESTVFSPSEVIQALDSVGVRYVTGKIKNRVIGED